MPKTSFLLCLTVALAAGAQKAVPTEDRDFQFLQDLTQTRSWTLGRPASIRLTPDGSTVLFLRGPPRKPELRLFSFDVASARTRELITPEQILGGAQEQLSAEERARRERKRVSTRGFTDYDLSYDGKLVLLTLSGRAYVLPVSGGQAKQVAGPGPKGEAVFDPRLSPDGKCVAFVRGGELWVAGVESGAERQITQGATPFVTHAQAEFVAQEELRRFTGYWWSSDSQWLVWEEADSRGVEKMWFGDPAHPENPVEETAYPRPGRPNAITRFGIVSARGGPTTWIDYDTKKWEYVQRVDWQPGAPLTLELLSRDQKDLALVAADPKTGKTRELLREHDDAWVEAVHDYHWLKNGSGFLWSSESGGEWQLQLRRPDGALVRALTPVDFGYAGGSEGRFGQAGLLHVDEQRGIAVVGRSPDPQDHQLYQVPLGGGAPKPLTQGPEIHSGVFAREALAWVRTTTARIRQRCLALDVLGVLQAPLELPKDRFLGVSTDTENERHAEFLLIRGIEVLKPLAILLRQVVEACAGLLDFRRRGERSGAVGEIRMGLDQLQLPRGLGRTHRITHGVEEGGQCWKRSLGAGGFSDPGSALEDAFQRGNEVGLPSRIEMIEGEQHQYLR